MLILDGNHSYMKKHALITGANKGIGLEIARQLGKKGYRIIFTTRFTERGEQAVEIIKKEGIDAFFVQLDVTDTTSILEAFRIIRSETGQIDVLVNNAGVLMKGDDNILTMEASGIYQTMHSNAMGALMVTRTFYPLLPQGGRVIMISSTGGSISKHVSTWAPVYCVSKTALNAITLQLADALKDQKIAVNAVCPGWVMTEMGGPDAIRSVEKGAETPVWLATEAPIELSGKFFQDKKEIFW